MNLTVRVAVVVALAVGASLAIGASGFSTTQADREVTVAVVGDEDAYLGLVYTDYTVEDPPDDIQADGSSARVEQVYENRTLATGTNQFAVDIAVEAFDVTVDSDDGVEVAVNNSLDGAELAVGEERNATVDVECPLAGGSATVSFDVAVSGPGVSAATTDAREVTITCPDRDVAGVLEPSGDGSLSVGPGHDKGVAFMTATNTFHPSTIGATLELTREGSLPVTEVYVDGEPVGIDDGTWSVVTEDVALHPDESVPLSGDFKCASKSTQDDGDLRSATIGVTLEIDGAPVTSDSVEVTCRENKAGS